MGVLQKFNFKKFGCNVSCRQSFKAANTESIHHFSAFSWCCIQKNRKFFKISPECIVAAMRISEAKEIIVVNEAVDEDGCNAVLPLTAANKRRFSFERYNISSGGELLFILEPKKKCRGVNNGFVGYEGECYSLSKLAVRLLNEMGREFSSSSKSNLGGKALSDIQEEMENEE